MTWILWRSQIRRLLAMFLLAVAGMSFLVFCASLVEFSRRAANSEIAFPLLLQMAGLQTPAVILNVLPLVWMLSSLWCFVGLARTQMFLVARVSGFTPWHILAPAVCVVAAIGLFAVTVANPVTASMTQHLQRLESIHLRGNLSLLEVFPTGIWLRQADRGGQSVLHARAANRQGTKLFDIEMFGFDTDGSHVRHITADSAVLAEEQWILRNAQVHELDAATPGELPPEFSATTYAWETHLTAQGILDSFGPPEAIQVWKLPTFIQTLVASGLDARRHIIHLHALWSLPVVMVAMALAAAAGGLRHPSLGHRFQRCVLVGLAGFAFFFMLYAVKTLAINGGPVALWIWGSAFVGLLVLGGAFLRMEPG